jgi:hypothetical protein
LRKNLLLISNISSICCLVGLGGLFKNRKPKDEMDSEISLVEESNETVGMLSTIVNEVVLLRALGN